MQPTHAALGRSTAPPRRLAGTTPQPADFEQHPTTHPVPAFGHASWPATGMPRLADFAHNPSRRRFTPPFLPSPPGASSTATGMPRVVDFQQHPPRPLSAPLFPPPLPAVDIPPIHKTHDHRLSHTGLSQNSHDALPSLHVRISPYHSTSYQHPRHHKQPPHLRSHNHLSCSRMRNSQRKHKEEQGE